MASGFFNGLRYGGSSGAGLGGSFSGLPSTNFGSSLFSSGLGSGGLDKSWDASRWQFGSTNSSGYGLRGNSYSFSNSDSGGGQASSMSAESIANIAGAAITAIGSGVSAALLQKGTNALYAAQAHIARNNAIMAENQAVQAKYAAEWQARKVSSEYGQLKAKQKVGQAASGIAIGVGSAAEVTASTDINKFIDKRQAMLNGLLESFSYKSRAASYRNQAIASDASQGSALSLGLGTAFNAGVRSYGQYSKKLRASLGD